MSIYVSRVSGQVLVFECVSVRFLCLPFLIFIIGFMNGSFFQNQLCDYDCVEINLMLSDDGRKRNVAM